MGTHSAQSPNSAVVDSNDAAARPDTVRPGSSPPLVMKEYWRGPPTAAPPGITELTALPTSWATAISFQCRLDVEIPMRAQTHAKLANSKTTMTTNQIGLILLSSS